MLEPAGPGHKAGPVATHLSNKSKFIRFSEEEKITTFTSVQQIEKNSNSNSNFNDSSNRINNSNK